MAKGKEPKGIAFDIDENGERWILPGDTREQLRETFKRIGSKITLELFISPDPNDPFSMMTLLLMNDMVRLSKKLTMNVNPLTGQKVAGNDVDSAPTLLVQPGMYDIRFRGAPVGEEGRALIEGIVLASRKDSGLSPEARSAMRELKDRRHIMVFYSHNCPYCPNQVLNGFKAAIERPDLVRADAVGVAENPDVADRFGIASVPSTVVNGARFSTGLEPEDRFIGEIVSMDAPEKWMPDLAPDKEVELDLLILGGGPAGLTAGIYSARSGLNTVVMENNVLGGQVALTPVVENYPGIKVVPGKQLVDMLVGHARNYVPIKEGVEIKGIERKKGERLTVRTSKGTFRAKAVILATGADHKKLGVPGEQRLRGLGISYCATCDGFMFRNKKVIIVGGGNGALTDALFLKSLGSDITIVHRKGEFRAQEHLRRSVEREGIPVLWDTIVEEIVGERKVEAVRLRNERTGKVQELKLDGVFISIGATPNVELARTIGIELGEGGFIKADRFGRTNIPYIYAAGDVTGGIRQIVTAISDGATASMAAFEDLSQPYWSIEAK